MINDLDYIPLNECKDRYLYILDARNSSLGVFNKDTNGFIIPRHDYLAGDVYLFEEQHWDNNDNGCGTAMPLKEIKEIPKELEFDSDELLTYLLREKSEYIKD